MGVQYTSYRCTVHYIQVYSTLHKVYSTLHSGLQYNIYSRTVQYMQVEYTTDRDIGVSFTTYR